MNKPSDDISTADIRLCTIKDKLIAIILDQQFDYCYDPCGKSWNELNDGLTERSRWAMKRLHSLVFESGDDRGQL